LEAGADFAKVGGSGSSKACGSERVIEGTLIDWYAEHGFGFIRPDGPSGDILFVKVDDLCGAEASIGQRVVFDKKVDEAGALCAVNVTPRRSRLCL